MIKLSLPISFTIIQHTILGLSRQNTNPHKHEGILSHPLFRSAGQWDQLMGDFEEAT